MELGIHQVEAVVSGPVRQVFLQNGNALFQTGYITFGCHTSFLKHTLDLFLNHSLELALLFIARSSRRSAKLWIHRAQVPRA